MASRTLIDTALKIYKSLGGNTSKVLGTRTNVNFLGKGNSPELMVDMDINPDALGVLPKSKAVEELESAMGYLTSGKLNDLQANQLIKNMNTMKSVYDPAPAPANITDMVTGTRNLDREGLASLRLKGDDFGYVRPEDMPAKKRFFRGVEIKDPTFDEDLPFDSAAEKLAEIKMSNEAFEQASKLADDLPPPGSRGGPDDIAAPFTGAGLESLKKVQNFDRTIGDDLVNKVYDMAGVSKNAQPVARGNARDFLNTIKDLEDPAFPQGPTLSSVMELDDLKFMTEGGGGALGDPLLLVQKYFGPRVASAVSQLDGRDQIELFAKRLVRVKDVKGNIITDRNFDPTTADFDFADGGRVPFFRGKLVGKALGLAKKAAATASGGKQMGYGDIRKYGLEAEDISRLFRDVAMDKSLVGKEKTLYMQRLNQVLKNPDDFPDGIREIQQMLGIDPIGFKGGGLAEILEV
jgi:hypothetical protein